MAELQAKQLKLAEKAGRMKQNIGVVSSRSSKEGSGIAKLTSVLLYEDCCDPRFR